MLVSVFYCVAFSSVLLFPDAFDFWYFSFFCCCLAWFGFLVLLESAVLGLLTSGCLVCLLWFVFFDDAIPELLLVERYGKPTRERGSLR